MHPCLPEEGNRRILGDNAVSISEPPLRQRGQAYLFAAITPNSLGMFILW